MISGQKPYMYSSGAVFWTVFSSINVQEIAMYSPDKLSTVILEDMHRQLAVCGDKQ